MMEDDLLNGPGRIVIVSLGYGFSHAHPTVDRECNAKLMFLKIKLS